MKACCCSYSDRGLFNSIAKFYVSRSLWHIGDIFKNRSWSEPVVAKSTEPRCGSSVSSRNNVSRRWRCVGRHKQSLRLVSKGCRCVLVVHCLLFVCVCVDMTNVTFQDFVCLAHGKIDIRTPRGACLLGLLVFCAFPHNKYTHKTNNTTTQNKHTQTVQFRYGQSIYFTCFPCTLTFFRDPRKYVVGISTGVLCSCCLRVLIVFLLFEMHIMDCCLLCSGEQAQNDRSADEYKLIDEIDEDDSERKEQEALNQLLNPSHWLFASDPLMTVHSCFVVCRAWCVVQECFLSLSVNSKFQSTAPFPGFIHQTRFKTFPQPQPNHEFESYFESDASRVSTCTVRSNRFGVVVKHYQFHMQISVPVDFRFHHSTHFIKREMVQKDRAGPHFQVF